MAYKAQKKGETGEKLLIASRFYLTWSIVFVVVIYIPGTVYGMLQYMLWLKPAERKPTKRGLNLSLFFIVDRSFIRFLRLRHAYIYYIMYWKNNDRLAVSNPLKELQRVAPSRVYRYVYRYVYRPYRLPQAGAENGLFALDNDPLVYHHPCCHRQF